MSVSDRNETPRKWSFRDARLPKRTDESDAFVEMWKSAWLSGADAAWATTPAINPHADDPARAAWQAGSDWARDHPDRRTTHQLRLAHSSRRATDPGRIPRAVKIGVFGLGLLAASQWVWRTVRRPKPG
jgi:predicted NAD/FAD-dependent oxidoreductase